MDFSELQLHPDVARGVADAGYVTCMPVQAAVFPHAFAGQDIYAQSQTGTGKTAAFLVSIFQRIMTDDASRHRKVLILAPTRELAVQIEDEAEKLGKYLPISMGCFYGGVSYGPQFDKLRDNVQMIIGTPGRIIDLIQQGKMMLREVGFLVVDEADRMFDMGFIDDLRKLLRYLPKPQDRQTYLFSATLGFRVKNLAWEYMDKPNEIVIEAETVTVEMVTQELYHVGVDEKLRVLLGILARDKPASALVFCNQKFMVEELARRLAINGIECEYIMGDLPQSKRLQVIDRLKAGKLSVLVATDVAARGLDVNALDLVVNYDVPADPESYVHRIGRTARAGAAGKAVTLACEKFVYGIPAIEKYIEARLPVLPVTAELLVEDKSASMRYGHTRDRGRPGTERERRAGDRRPGAREPYGRDRRGHDSKSRPGSGGERRPLERHPGERHPGERSRATESAHDVRQPASAAPDARRAERVGDLNPYTVSAEERMRRYKEKYAGAAQAGSPKEGERRPADPAQGSSRPGPTRGDQRRSDAPHAGDRGRQDTRPRTDGRPADTSGKAPGGQARRPPAGSATSPSKPAASKPSTTQKPAAQPAKPAAKQGILDRIKGLFGGGKKS